MSYFSRISIGFFIAASLLPVGTVAASLPDGTIAKSTNSPSYYYILRGERLAFPSEETLRSWYPDALNVSPVSDEQLSSYPLRRNVTYKPGSKLVKFMSDTAVYVIARTNILRLVPTPEIAVQLFGQNWQNHIETLPITVFPNYQMGNSVSGSLDYRPEQERSVVNIAENTPSTQTFIEPLPSKPEETPTLLPGLSVKTNTHTAVLNQVVTITASVVSSTEAFRTIEIYNDVQNGPIMSCVNTTSCSVTVTISKAPGTIRYSARGFDGRGRAVVSSSTDDAVLDIPDASQRISISAFPSRIASGEKVNYSFSVNAPEQIMSHHIYAAIPGEPRVVVWHNCDKRAICSANVPFYRTTQLFSHVVTTERVYDSEALTVSVTGSSVPTPALSIKERTSSNEATLHIEAPTGPTIGWSMLVDGTTEEDTALSICAAETCDIDISFTGTHAYRVFTSVGGKLEGSNIIHLTSKE